MKRTKIVDALRSTAFGEAIDVKGWVRSHRSSKAVDFIALNDGSTIKNIQIVADTDKFDDEILRQITTGACIHVEGTLVESQGKGQTSEILATAIEIYGLCGNDYPMQKKGQSFEYMRKYAHMRLRTNTFGAVIIWRLPSTHTSTSTVISTSTHLSSQLLTVRAQVRCSR